jgi:hypothetical protein
MSNRSAIVTAPMITPRFARVSPNEAIENLSEEERVARVYNTWCPVCEICGRGLFTTKDTKSTKYGFGIG